MVSGRRKRFRVDGILAGPRPGAYGPVARGGKSSDESVRRPRCGLGSVMIGHCGRSLLSLPLFGAGPLFPIRVSPCSISCCRGPPPRRVSCCHQMAWHYGVVRGNQHRGGWISRAVAGARRRCERPSSSPRGAIRPGLPGAWGKRRQPLPHSFVGEGLSPKYIRSIRSSSPAKPWVATGGHRRSPHDRRHTAPVEATKVVRAVSRSSRSPEPAAAFRCRSTSRFPGPQESSHRWSRPAAPPLPSDPASRCGSRSPAS